MFTSNSFFRYLSIYLSIYLSSSNSKSNPYSISIYLSILCSHLTHSFGIYLSIYLSSSNSKSNSNYLSIYLSIYLCEHVCWNVLVVLLFVFSSIQPFKRTFVDRLCRGKDPFNSFPFLSQHIVFQLIKGASDIFF